MRSHDARIRTAVARLCECSSGVDRVVVGPVRPSSLSTGMYDVLTRDVQVFPELLHTHGTETVRREPLVRTN